MKTVLFYPSPNKLTNKKNKSNMLISKFIENYEINQVTIPEVEGLIEQCLTKLQPFYGYRGDVFSPNTWDLGLLREEENIVKQDSDELIRYVDAISLQMTNEAMFNISSDTKNRVYKYKDRTKITLPNGKLLTNDFIKVPLILALNDLLKTYNQEQPDISYIIRSTRLISYSEQLRLLIQLSELWVDLSKRNINQQQVDDKNEKFDNEPMNLLKKSIVCDFIKDNFNNDNTTEIQVVSDHLEERIKSIYENDIDGKYLDLEDELLRKVKITALTRWVDEATLKFKRN